MVPILIYKALLATFGMDSARPFQVIEVLSFLLSDALLFIWIRRRVGAWLALAAVVPILFLGSAYEDLLWQFQVGYFGSMACGLGMLLALDRDDRVGDRWACALLAASMTFSSVGLAFLAPALVHVAWDERRRRRAYVVAIPAALYALWWLGWGHTAPSTLESKNLATSASYTLDGLSASLASLLGLATSRDDASLTPVDWGRPLLFVAAGFAAWRAVRIRPIARSLVAVAMLALAFWFMAAANAEGTRAATVPRYQYVGAVLVLLIAAELLRGVRIGPLVRAGSSRRRSWWRPLATSSSSTRAAIGSPR